MRNAKAKPVSHMAAYIYMIIDGRHHKRLFMPLRATRGRRYSGRRNASTGLIPPVSPMPAKSNIGSEIVRPAELSTSGTMSQKFMPPAEWMLIIGAASSRADHFMTYASGVESKMKASVNWYVNGEDGGNRRL